MDHLEPSALAAGGAAKGSLGVNDGERSGGVRRSPPSATQALANVLAISARLSRPDASDPGDRDDHSPEVVTTVTTVTTADDGDCPDEWGCEHEWTLRLGGRWGLYEAYCGKCGEVAVRRAA